MSSASGAEPSFVVSSERSTMKPKQWLKLEKYDGQSPIEAFLAKYEICAKHNLWDSSERLSQLMCSLTGTASQVLWEFNASGVTTWNDLVTKLRARYGSSDQTALYRTQLRTRRQKEGEGLPSLAQDIRRLMVLAYPGAATEMSEMVAIDAFLDALIDPELALRVRDREPTTLDLACQYATRLEANQRTRAKEDPHERRFGRTKAIKESEVTIDQLSRQINEQMKSLEQRQSQVENYLMGFNQNLAGSIEQTGVRPPHNPFTYQRPSDRRNNGTSFRSSPAVRRPNNRCYHCNQPGHIQRNCPQRSSLAETPEIAHDAQDTANARYIQGSSNAYLPMRVNGQNVLSLIDSGSEMSLIPASLVRLNDLSRTQQMLKAANGTSIKVLGKTNVTCELADTTFVIPCLVTEQLSEMVIGFEWLERQDAVWNFNQRWIQLQGLRFSLYSLPRSSKCRKVAEVQLDVKEVSRDIKTFNYAEPENRLV